MWYGHKENGGGLVSEENSKIRSKWCEVEKIAQNGIDGQSEESVE